MSDHTFSAADRRVMALDERRRVCETLRGLTAEQWAAPSLCEGWSVRDVAGHLAANASAGLLPFLGGMAAVRFDHDEYNRRGARRWSRRSDREILAALDSGRVMTVFRLAPDLLLVDHVVHHQDIRRPLGLPAEFPDGHLRAALESIFSSGMFAAEAKRWTETRLVATDLDWSHGEGEQEIRGPAEYLIVRIMGRAVDPGEPHSADAPASSTAERNA